MNIFDSRSCDLADSRSCDLAGHSLLYMCLLICFSDMCGYVHAACSDGVTDDTLDLSLTPLRPPSGILRLSNSELFAVMFGCCDLCVLIRLMEVATAVRQL